MAELRTLCGELGWSSVRTYIQSGNIVLFADKSLDEVENELESAIERQFGFSAPAIVRDVDAWNRYVTTNPFEEASASEPNRVMLTLSKAKPKPTALEELQVRAAENERIVCVDDAIWIHYGSGIGRSKLTTPLVDRLVGSTVTTRNWRTVLMLQAMLRELHDESE